ncbi:MAG TPA: serine/threonine-protein kinase [Polyangiaceae bacterium]|nr:serine/threonine-protein kinase [Polyangiaceae bacterium]
MTTNTASHHEAEDNIAAPARVGDVVADKYLIEETLGVGGMGVVVAARDQVLDRRVAIKFLLPKLAGSDTAVQRFVREARAATRVTSEHVVRLLEIEKLPSGTPFFVMEYLEGSDLRALLRERGPLAPSLAVDYVLQALQAVAEGHVKGIVHRDIKPGNLFLTARADGTALIKVLDFGIAKTLDEASSESTSLTSSDDVRLGSPAYMPPEQLQNPRNVDKRSDIWSIGATLYELLCGRPPFEAQGYLELASRILSQPPVPLSEQPVPNTLPKGLEAVLRRCLEKDRHARYANAAELAAALAPFGSEDARVSLGRVNGMFNSSSSIPALTRSVALGAETCAATLEVPTGPEQSPDERRTSDIGAVASTPPSRSGRSWLVLAAAAALIGGVFALRGPAAVAPHGDEQAPPAAAAVTVPAVAPVAAPESVAAPVAAAASVVAPVSAPQPALPRAVAGRLKSKPLAAQPAAPAKPATEAPSAPAAELEAQAEPTPAAASGLGRSEEIERLIEVRR